MTHRDFAQMSEQTINHVAARARKEGIVMPRSPEDYSSMFDENYEQNEQLEYQERERRIADANVHYRNMHGLLDLGFEDKDTAFLAQQAVENAMKGLISALGEEYNTHHSTRAFGRDIRRLDPGGEWHFASNLGQKWLTLVTDHSQPNPCAAPTVQDGSAQDSHPGTPS